MTGLGPAASRRLAAAPAQAPSQAAFNSWRSTSRSLATVSGRAGGARRLVEQHHVQLPARYSQRQPARQAQQQPGLPSVVLPHPLARPGRQCMGTTVPMPSPRALEWRGCVQPRRWPWPIPGRTVIGAAPWVGKHSSRCGPLFGPQLGGGATPPAVKQPAQFFGQAADMLKLPAAQPLSAPGQLQVLAQLVEMKVGIAQRGGAGAGVEMARGDQRVVQPHRQIADEAAQGMAVLTRPARRLRHQPFHQTPSAGVHHHRIVGRQSAQQ